MLFVGGPSTIGSGKIVNTEFAEAIRSHKVNHQIVLYPFPPHHPPPLLPQWLRFGEAEHVTCFFCVCC